MTLNLKRLLLTYSAAYSIAPLRTVTTITKNMTHKPASQFVVNIIFFPLVNIKLIYIIVITLEVNVLINHLAEDSGNKFFCLSIKSMGQEKMEAIARRCSMKKGNLRNFAKFTGKHLCQSLSFNRPATLF